MLLIKSYIKDAILSSHIRIAATACEDVFVRVICNSNLKEERFIREGEMLDIAIELQEGRNNLQLQCENIEGERYIINR